MRQWTAALDAMCARINPALVLAAIAIALLNFVVAAQRWSIMHPASSLPVKSAVATQAIQTMAWRGALAF